MIGTFFLFSCLINQVEKHFYNQNLRFSMFFLNERGSSTSATRRTSAVATGALNKVILLIFTRLLPRTVATQAAGQDAVGSVDLLRTG